MGHGVSLWRAWNPARVPDQILADPAVAASAPRTLMWDNLSAHRNAMVYNTVTGAGHRVLQRPPYRPVDGPIEYS